MFTVKKMDLLISLYIFCVLAAELMGTKTIHLFDLYALKLNISVAIFVLPFIFTINDIIIEVFGKARAQSVVRRYRSYA